MSRKFKLGLDYNGVISDHSGMLAILSSILVKAGHEVHIITGRRQIPEFEEELDSLGIRYTHFFSIADHHKELGTPMVGYENNEPWLDANIWDATKADYCKRVQIDMHIDDSDTYGQYFETVYLQINKLEP